MPQPILFPLNLIRVDADLQARVHPDQATVDSYASDMEAGQTFPPLILFDDGEAKWLAAGHHRHPAAVKAGKQDFPCEIRKGTREDALWFAVGDNKDHGLRRTNRDKKRAAKMALKHPKGVKLSNRKLAEYVGIDDKTVARYRAELEATAEIPQLSKRTTKNGREMNTRQIGKPNHKPGIAGTIKAVIPDEFDAELAKLPEDQREACYDDYIDECSEAGDVPTGEGLAKMVDTWTADNQPYVETSEDAGDEHLDDAGDEHLDDAGGEHPDDAGDEDLDDGEEDDQPQLPRRVQQAMARLRRLVDWLDAWGSGNADYGKQKETRALGRSMITRAKKFYGELDKLENLLQEDLA